MFVIGLLDVSPNSRSDISNKMTFKKIYFQRLPLSKFQAKTLSKFNCKENFLKNLWIGIKFKLQVAPLMSKINKHNISGVMVWVAMANYVSTY